MKQHYQHKSAVISNKAFQTSEAFVSILDKDSSFKNAVLVSLNQVSQIKCLSSTQKQQYIRQINLTFYEKKSKKKKKLFRLQSYLLRLSEQHSSSVWRSSIARNTLSHLGDKEVNKVN